MACEQVIKVAYSNFLEARKILDKNFKRGNIYTFVTFDVRNRLPKSEFIKVFYFVQMAFEWYPTSFLLVGQDKNKQKMSIRLYEGADFILWEGVVNPNIDPIAKYAIEDTSSGPVNVASRWTPYDTRYLYRALDSVQIKPLLYHIGPVYEPERLIKYVLN